MLRSRRAQAAVETMMMAFLVTVVLVSMAHLFTVTWAAHNAHARAREAVLHGDAYLRGPRLDFVEATRIPFDPSTSVRNYRRADPDVPLSFEARAWDRTRDDLIGPQDIEVFARIVE